MALTAQIGLPVQFNLPEGAGPDQNTAYAAVITSVNANGTVNLTVFVDGGSTFTAQNVPAQAEGMTTFYIFVSFS